MTKLKTQHESLESENKFLRTQVGNNVELIKIIEKLIEKPTGNSDYAANTE